MALFSEDTRFLVFMDARASTPSQTITRRADLKPVFVDLRQYEATTHFNGQSTVTLNGAVATGESYCLAHHVQVQDGRRSLMIASIRYLEAWRRQPGVQPRLGADCFDRFHLPLGGLRGSLA